MKKYWIKDLNENQVIHAPTEDIALKLCKKFHELGLKWINGNSYLQKDSWEYNVENTCYVLKKGTVANIVWSQGNNCEILTIDQLYDFERSENEQKTFPRRMLVWDDIEDGAEEMELLHVFPESFGLKYRVITRNLNRPEYIRAYKHMKELPEVKKMTKEEIEKELGYRIKIVD